MLHQRSGRFSDFRITLLSEPSRHGEARQWHFRISSPITAAGPFPNYPGFPFKPLRVPDNSLKFLLPFLSYSSHRCLSTEKSPARRKVAAVLISARRFHHRCQSRPSSSFRCNLQRAAHADISGVPAGFLIFGVDRSANALYQELTIVA